MSEKDDFINLLKSDESADKIYEDYLMSSHVWLFDHYFTYEKHTKYDLFKKLVASKLALNSTEICIVGSGKLGFSQSPFKDFSEFDLNKSDIDVVIVSQKLFNKYWELLLSNFYSKKNYVDPMHMENAFKKFVNINPKNSTGLSSAFGRLNVTFGELQRDFFVQFTISNNLNYRIYQNWSSVKQYHVNGLNELKKKVSG